MNKYLATLLLLALSHLGLSAGTVTDVITGDKLLEKFPDQQNVYTNFNGMQFESNAVYNATCYVNTNTNAIQFRTTNSNTGFVTTRSGGIATKVTVTWGPNNSTSNYRAIVVYGKHTPYESPTDLFDTDLQGDSICAIEYRNTGMGEVVSYALSGSYEYIGLCSANAAVFIYEISIDYEEEIPKIERLNALSDVRNNTKVEIAADMTVVYANEVINLIYDGNTYMGLVTEQTLEEGEIIKAGWEAVYDRNMLQSADQLTIVGKAEVPQPKEVSFEMLRVTQPNWDYQTLVNIQVPDNIGEGYARFNDPIEGDVLITIQIYNYLNIDEVSTGRYKIRGFWMQRQIDDEYTTVFVPIEFEPYTVKIERLSELTETLYYTDVEVTTDMTVVCADRGFNLIYDGYSYMGYFSNQTLEEGDIIKSGWSAYYIYDELLGSGEVIIAGKAEVPQPKEITPEMLISPQPNWDYQVLMNIHAPNGIDVGYARFNDSIEGEVTIQLYNYLNIDEVRSGRYNIRGFWMQHQTDNGYNKVFVPIEFEPYTVKIERLMELEDVLYYTDVDITTDMTVVFANRNINLLYDGVGYMGLVANQALEDGDIINANWSAFYTGYMLVENDGIDIGGKTVVPEPTMVTTEYLMHPQHRWEYLMLLNIYLPDGLGEGTSTVYIHYNDPAEGDVSIPIQFSNYLNINHVRTGRYNIRGFWMPLGHSDQLEFVPIEFVEQYDKIDSLSAFTTIPDNTTIEIAADMTVAFSNEYINLIYDGVNYMGLAANQTLELGDVIKAGWTAVYADKKLQAAEGLTINGKAEVPQPKEITPDMLIYPQPNWDYQVLTPMLLAVNMAQYGMGEAYGQFESEEGPENVPVQVFDVLGIGPVEKGRYNIRGFWMQYNLGDDEYTTVFVPIEFLPYYDKVERLSTLVDFPDKTTIEIAADMTVVYANKVINLIFDGTSYMGLVANRNLEVGDVIKAGWTAVYSERKLHAASTLNIDGSAEVPESKEITPEMLMYQQPNWDYQVLLNIYVPESMEEGMKTVYAQFNDPNEGRLVEIPIQLFNYLSLEDFNPGYYNIRGFWMSVHLGEEYMETFVPIEFIPTKTIIYSLNALIDVHTGEEFIYESDLTVAYVMGDGHIGIYDGRTFGMLFDNHTSLEAGDIIKGGWVGTISSGMLYCTEDLVINSKAESAPIPVSVEAEDINESRIKWNWVTINNITVPDTYCKDFYAYVTCTKEWTEFNWFYIIDRFSITEEGTLEPGVYNVTGTWIKDAEYGWVLSPTSFEDITPIIDSISDIANIPYGTPIVVGVDLSISAQAEDFFEVFDGKKFGAVATHDAMEMIQFDFDNGDIIAKGWRATINNNKITPIFHNLTSDGATTPQPASEVVAINLEGSKYPFNYVTIMNVTVEEPIALNDCAELISIADIYGNTISTSFILNNLYGLEIPTGILDITGIWQWSGDGLGGSQYKLFPLEVRPTEYTGINDVIVDMDKVEYYNMAGMKIDEPKAGSMVIRIANGKAEKFFKK